MTAERDANFYRNSKREYPVIERAKGIRVYDSSGREYIDFGSGIGVTSIGYSVDEVTRQIARQLEKTTFVYNGYFTNRPRMELADRLVSLCPPALTKVIFANSGSEANEVAIKIARQYHCETGNDTKYKVISRRLSYHGNTMGSLSVSGRATWRALFLPYMQQFPQIAPPYCYRCPFGASYPACGVQCACELEQAIAAEGEETVSAFIAEPIIGTTVAGATPPKEYYDIIRDICDKYNVLFIADEVITGLGRTGSNLGMDHWHVVPDLVSVAKGLAAGYAPLSAVIVQDRVFKGIAQASGAHTQGFTYTGNPLSCAAGLAVLEYIEANGLIAAARERGDYLRSRLETLQDTGIVGDIRGKGLFQGVEFVADPQTREPFPAAARLTERIMNNAFSNGLILITGLAGCADGKRGDQLQISPALVITEQEIDSAIEIMRTAIAQALQELRARGH